WGGAALLGIGTSVPLAVAAILAAAAAAGYSGFLFGQAEGRDFWQSPLLPLHLIVQAVVAGAGVLAIGAFALGGTPPPALVVALGIGVAAHVLVVASELLTPHANRDVAVAAQAMTNGPDAALFWYGAMALGAAVPLVILAAQAAGLLPAALSAAAAGLAATAGLLAYEHSWIRAGQAPPLS
ncbi:MAG: NrfD/PsrC family molybdoenzyme membrane anchor subunit, partial [Chloroflexota bacterium]